MTSNKITAKIITKHLPVLLLLFLLACSNTSENKVNITKSENNKNNYSEIVLTVKRGAFHYDKFILKDTIITFYPAKEKLLEKYDKYNYISEQKISKQTRDQFIKHIVDAGFFKLKNKYNSQTTCNSSLIVTLKLGDKTKRIISEDYQRKCPELLKFIEKQIILLHNKKLVRVILPG